MNATLLHDLFHLDIPVIEKIIRPVIVYGFLIIGLRLSGKRELAQLNPFDLVVLLMLSNTVQNAIIGNDNTLTGGLIGAATLLVLNYVVVGFTYRRMKLERFIEGSADLLVKNGQPILARLHRERITLAELRSAARRSGFASLDDVKEAVLEPNGTVSFIARDKTSDVLRYEDLLARLERIEQKLDERR
jgi:uncharacterized membrane protein YcaP (DUF421 family)